jgi:3-hydroxyisobutyrate dehydrogenase
MSTTGRERSKDERVVGIAGLGRMGHPIASNLLVSGFRISVWNRTPDKIKDLVAKGARKVESPQMLAAAAPIILTSLADPDAVKSVYLGADGLLAGARPGTILVDLSTVDPTLSRHLAQRCLERQCQFLDAPVAGSVTAARERSLAFMVGGDRASYDACQDIFKAVGRISYFMGDSGSGSVMKLVSNSILATMVQALAEGIALGEKAGLGVADMMSVIGSSSAAAPVVNAKAQTITERAYVPAMFTLRLMQKDLWLALSMANELTVPMPATALAHDLVVAANATGKSDHDFSAVALLMEELSGLTGGDT